MNSLQTQLTALNINKETPEEIITNASPVTINENGTEVKPLLSNVMEHADTLRNISSSAEYFAMNTITNKIGYHVMRDLLWKFRKSQRGIPVAPPTIDDVNDEEAKAYEALAMAEFSKGAGLPEVVQFNAIPLAGVYKKLIITQKCKIAYSKDNPVKENYEILFKMISERKTEEISEAYKIQIEAEVSTNADAKAIKDKLTSMGAKFDARRKAQQDQEYNVVCKEARSFMLEDLTNELWESLPITLQYELVYPIRMQALSAYAYSRQMTIREANDDHAPLTGSEQRTLDLLHVLRLELEAAARTPEVQAAFTAGRLQFIEDLSKEYTAEEPKMIDKKTIMMIDGKEQSVRTRQPERV